MYCPACGRAREGAARCAGCGAWARGSTATLLAGLLTFAFAAAASIFYLWKLLPTLAAMHYGFGLELPALSVAHAQSGSVQLLLWVLGGLACLAGLLGVAAARRLAPALAAVAAGCVVFLVAGLLSTLLSLAVRFPDAMRDRLDEAGQLNAGVLAAQSGDLEKAAKAFESAVSLDRQSKADHWSCRQTPGFAQLQLAEVRRAQGRADEARKAYEEAVAEAARRQCPVLAAPVAERAKAGMAALAGPASPASPSPTP